MRERDGRRKGVRDALLPEEAEVVMRSGLLRLSGTVLGEALSADAGYRVPRVDCGHVLAPPTRNHGQQGPPCRRGRGLGEAVGAVLRIARC